MNTYKNILFLILIIILFSCNSKPEPKLQLFNPEAFAFDIGDSWEVNAAVNTKGFAQKEQNGKWEINLSYNVDLVTPGLDSLVSIFENRVKEESTEEFSDLQLEAQIEIDTAFGIGNYKLVFNVTDELAKQSKSMYINLDVTKD